MKKKEKNYSIIIVSGATSTNREFVISSRLIKNSIIAVSILLFIFGIMIYDYLTTSFDKEKLDSLKKESKRKDEEIKTLSLSIKEFEAKLKVMMEYKERIAVAMGLNSPNALQEVGSGGPINNFSTDLELNGPEVLDNNKFINKPKFPTPTSSTENILKKTNNIRKEALKIESTLKFVETVMEEQKVRLASIPSVWPTRGYLTSAFGERIHPFTGRESFHNGQDIATQYGNKVIAPANGIVLVSEYQDYYGNLVVIDHGFGFTTRYGHLSSSKVKEGDRVKRFQVIGYVGNTGRSSAPHLHYEVRYFGNSLNPINFIIE